jgi:hypothetical protein
MTLSTGISPQLYLLVAALAEKLNGKGPKRACKNSDGASRHEVPSTTGLLSSPLSGILPIPKG